MTLTFSRSRRIHASDAKVADRPFSDREQEGAAALGGEGKQATSESGNKAGESKNTTGSKTDETTASAKETAQMAKDTIAEHGTDTGHTTGGGAGHKS